LAGHNSLGKGSLAGTALEEVLPVQTQGIWDLRRAPAQVPEVAAQALPWVVGLWRGPAPRVDWYQETTAKPGATVSLTLGGRPLLVTSPYGKGRVAVLTATIFIDSAAERAAAAPLFPDWPGYRGFLQSLLQWLAGQAPG
jgi:uncharacterized membrane protein